MSLQRSGTIPSLASSKIMQTVILDALRKLGKIGVDYAIKNHEFQNRSNNLEDSYGFAIYYNKAIIEQPFMYDKNAIRMVEVEGKMYSGYREGQKFLLNYKPDTNSYTLVVVAGMIYASFVEGYYGLDVLQGSYLKVQEEAPRMFKNLKWKNK